MFEGLYNNNWVFGLSLGMFVYAGMGVLLPELDTSIGNSVGQGFNKWICLVLDIKRTFSDLSFNKDHSFSIRANIYTVLISDLKSCKISGF